MNCITIARRMIASSFCSFCAYGVKLNLIRSGLLAYYLWFSSTLTISSNVSWHSSMFFFHHANEGSVIAAELCLLKNTFKHHTTYSGDQTFSCSSFSSIHPKSKIYRTPPRCMSSPPTQGKPDPTPSFSITQILTWTWGRIRGWGSYRHLCGLPYYVPLQFCLYDATPFLTAFILMTCTHESTLPNLLFFFISWR